MHTITFVSGFMGNNFNRYNISVVINYKYIGLMIFRKKCYIFHFYCLFRVYFIYYAE